MKALGWIFAGIGVGVLTYIVLNQPGPQYATGSDDVEDAADKTSLWGSKQRATGTGGQFFGKLKETAGQVTGDDSLAAEGRSDQVIGTVKDAAGAVAHAAGETLHELNR